MMRVFIADDEEIIRDGIRNCIEKEQERFLFAVKRRTAKWHCLC